MDYVSGTLLSIGNVGDREKVLVSDGPLTDGVRIPDGWRVEELPWRGVRALGWWCFSLALSRQVENLLLLQDDIVVCDGGGSVMDRCPVPDNCGVTTFYSGQSLPDLQPKSPGAPRFIVVGAMCTAQALKFPRRSLEFLCSKDPKNVPNLTDEPHYFDNAFCTYLRESPWPNVAHLVPNIVRHIGEISACGTINRFHQPWSVKRGEQFPGDVMNLPVYERPYIRPTL